MVISEEVRWTGVIGGLAGRQAGRQASSFHCISRDFSTEMVLMIGFKSCFSLALMLQLECFDQ